MKKNDYRKIFKAKRLWIAPGEKEQLDKAICAQLQSFDWSTKTFVHVFLPLEKFNEPDIFPFLSYLHKLVNLKLVIAKSNVYTHTMEHYLWEQDTILEANPWGILEPSQEETLKTIEPDLIDVVLVPLLVVDEKGNRVGYGKGYYDRFLAQCRPDVSKIGISYFEPVSFIEDVGHWDVPVDYLVTPQKIHRF